MKISKLKSLAAEINMGTALVSPEDVILRIEDKGDLENTFPVPDCSNCQEKCCPPRVVISLFDLVRFTSYGLQEHIAGQFKGFVELFLSDDGKDVDLTRPHMFPTDPDAKDCVFLDEDRNCSIYQKRPLICRSYPVVIRIDEDKNRVALWLGGCQKYKILSDKTAFQRLLNSAIQDYNEKLTSNALLMYSRSQLRDMGLGEYLEDEWHLLTEYNTKNKDMQKQIEDLQQVAERLRAPQDYTNIMQRLEDNNDWLKERVENLEIEVIQQRERAHSIISELTKQLSEQRKLMEDLRQSDDQGKRSRWKR
ncbi:YkgJ family cysteine cluster protein [Candidatus Poribacteria bacterium]